jgi:hypothetical protein
MDHPVDQLHVKRSGDRHGRSTVRTNVASARGVTSASRYGRVGGHGVSLGVSQMTAVDTAGPFTMSPIAEALSRAFHPDKPNSRTRWELAERGQRHCATARDKLLRRLSFGLVEHHPSVKGRRLQQWIISAEVCPSTSGVNLVAKGSVISC